MNKFLLAGIFLLSASAFSDELAGLKCDSQYVVHEVNTAYKFDVIRTRNLTGLISILKASSTISVNNSTKNYSEGLSLDNGFNMDIHFTIDVQKETTSITITSSKANDTPRTLLDHSQYNTQEGFVITQSLSNDFIYKYGKKGSFDHFANLIVTCLPAYK